MTMVCMRASSETPVLYFYGELDEGSRTEFERHLSTCAECAGALADLQHLRAALAERGRPTRSPANGNAFMRRLDQALGTTHEPPSRFALGRPEARATSRLRASRSGGRAHEARGAADDRNLRGSAPWLAVAAALLIGVVLGLVWQQRALGPRPTQASGTPAAEALALDEAAARHFERAKIVVLGLALKDSARATATDWEYERELAASLLPETRLYRLAAEDRGDRRLAGLLSDLETVLLQASMSADAETPELKRLQRIIRGRDLIVRMETTRGI
jgi:hypothetical protein